MFVPSAASAKQVTTADAATAHRLRAALVGQAEAGDSRRSPIRAAVVGDDKPAGASLVSANTLWFEHTGFAGTDAGEPLTTGSDTCAGVRVDHTVWFRVRGNGARLFITTEGSDFDTVIAAYPAASLTASSRLGCGDDTTVNGALQPFSTLSVPTTAGVEYLIQVGGCVGHSACGAASGNLQLGLLASDDRANAELLELNSADTRSNWATSTEANEPLTCGGASYSSTVWFRFDVPAVGRVTFNATTTSQPYFFVTAVALYREGGPLLGCGIGSTVGAAGGQVSVDDLPPGRYQLQVGSLDGSQGNFGYHLTYVRNLDVDKDNSNVPYDCNDGNAAIHPGAADPTNGVDDNCDGVVDPDLDGDGYAGRRLPGGRDCNDNNPAIRPGAREIPGNSVDENCDRRLGYRTLHVTVPARLYPAGQALRFRALEVRRLPARSTLRVRCSGPGCSKKKPLVKRFRKRRDRYNLMGYARGVRLIGKTRLEIRITRRNYVGKVITFARTRNIKVERCLPPGAKRPRRC